MLSVCVGLACGVVILIPGIHGMWVRKNGKDVKRKKYLGKEKGLKGNVSEGGWGRMVINSFFRIFEKRQKNFSTHMFLEYGTMMRREKSEDLKKEVYRES